MISVVSISTQTITVTSVELSIIATCLGGTPGWFCIPSPTTAPESVTGNPLIVATSGNAPVGGAVVEITITSTQSLTVFETAAAAETIHPATAGWQYGGCYKDDTVRALQNESITATVVGGMTTEICITFCKTLGYRLAGTEAGYMCFCGDEVVDSWRIAESDCSIPCEGEPEFVCGGNLALSIWSITGRVPKAPGPEMNFTVPTLSPGQTEMADFTGAVRQSLVPMTSAVWEWPADEDDLNDDDIGTEEEVSRVAIVTNMALKNKQPNPTAIDAEGMASSVRAIVSAAMDEVQRMAASEVARAKAMIDEAHTVVG
ncbi:WSC domain-containing protein [Neurospora tetraspora]|uniref:WSC domain-containing protein n=1 Tax=Neurospora tetraspora TaxID=94610 RepID=A0AAE0JHI0_9PEZI|nr:WSC domain-containing protein [Neurospora tetraspora]